MYRDPIPKVSVVDRVAAVCGPSAECSKRIDGDCADSMCVMKINAASILLKCFIVLSSLVAVIHFVHLFLNEENFENIKFLIQCYQMGYSFHVTLGLADT